MRAALRNGEGQLALEQRCADQAAAALGADGMDRVDVGVAAAEGDDPFGVAARGLDEPVAVRAIVGDDCDPVRLEALENLGLGVGDRFFRTEVFDVRGRDGGDQRDVRPDLPGQRGDLAVVAHAHLEHRELGVARHAGEAERDAGVIVVALDRAVDLAGTVAVERGEQGFLGAGFADRTGDAEDGRVATLARARGQATSSAASGVGDEHVRAFDRLRDDGAGGPGGERAGDERWPS